jgi:hypothetical protein
VLFEGIERDQEEDRARAVERVIRSHDAPSWMPVRFAHPLPDGRGWAGQRGLLVTTLESDQGLRWASIAAHADRIDGRFRRLEEQLEQLVLRFDALARS